MINTEYLTSALFNALDNGDMAEISEELDRNPVKLFNLNGNGLIFNSKFLKLFKFTPFLVFKKILTSELFFL